MTLGDAYFATVENKFCCSELFLSTDLQPIMTGHRRSLKPGAVPSVFPWKKVDDHEESLKMNERLLHELQESKSKERIYKFGLQRFSSSSEDIMVYTGFPDYPTLIEFWKYVEPSASNLTYYSYVRNNSDSISLPGR